MPRVKKSTLPKFDPVKPHVLIQRHKYGTFLYSVHDAEQLYRTALSLAAQNFTDGYYEAVDDEEDDTSARDMRSALAANDGAKVWEIMQWRSHEGHEHEGVELTQPESL